MTPKLASTGQTSTNQCLHVVVWIFAHKISLNWNRFHHVNLAIIALLVNLIFRFYNGSVWQTGRVWATILVPMEFFQPTLSFETKNSIFLSDGDTLNFKTKTEQFDDYSSIIETMDMHAPAEGSLVRIIWLGLSDELQEGSFINSNNGERSRFDL